MTHEFIKMDKKDIPETATFLLKGDNEFVVLDDYAVVNNPLFLGGFDTYKVSFANKGEGLDYHGNTIIPTSSLPKFISNIEEAMRTTKSKDLLNQMAGLIQFCKRAIGEEKYVIHFGL